MLRPILLIQIALVLGLAGLLLWRSAITDVGGFQIGLDGGGRQLVRLLGEWKFWLGTAVLLVVGVVLLDLYGNEDISQVIPMFSLGYVYTAILGKYFLDEQVTAMRWLGIVVIIIGVAIMVRS